MNKTSTLALLVTFVVTGFLASAVNGQESGEDPPQLDVSPARALHEQPVSTGFPGFSQAKRLPCLPKWRITGMPSGRRPRRFVQILMAS